MIKQASENTNYRWVILGTVFWLQFFCSMANNSFGPLAPFLIADLKISRAQLGLFSSLAFLAAVIFSMPVGWMVDRFGVRRLLLLGPGIFGILFALFSLIPNVGVGYVVVFLIGTSYQFLNPASAIALVSWFPLKSRATAVSIKQSGVTVGSAIGAIIIPSLCVWLGWRNAVAILGVAVIVIAVLGFSIYREWPRQSSKPQTPVLANIRQAIANKNLLYLGLTCTCYSVLQVSTTIYLVLQMVEMKRISAVEAGTFLMAANIGGAVGRIMWGSISDRLFGGRRSPVLFIIGVIGGILAIILSICMAGMSNWILYILIFIFGAMALGWTGVFMVFATELSGKESAATGLGWAIGITTIGGMVGAPVFGYIVDKTSSYTPAWLAVGIVTIVGALLMTLIRANKIES
jgi:MFS transporter, ACS family, hexuronate transporter